MLRPSFHMAWIVSLGSLMAACGNHQEPSPGPVVSQLPGPTATLMPTNLPTGSSGSNVDHPIRYQPETLKTALPMPVVAPDLKTLTPLPVQRLDPSVTFSIQLVELNWFNPLEPQKMTLAAPRVTGSQRVPERELP